MSLPPINPEKTTAGIIVDPKTLERVVPSSRRSDGTTRKELKIRPGFTPQEDIGVFRSARQQSQKPSTVPGSNNRPLASTSTSTAKTENPFAQPQAAKTKAQLKNEKRREKKRLEASNKAWDESSTDEDDTALLKDTFAAADRARGVNTEEKFPSLPTAAPGAPASPLELGSAAPEISGPGVTAILDTVPGGAGSDAPDSAADLPDAPPPPPIMSPKAEVKKETKPHPIQGGRKGPIGLAFPPPIEESKPTPPSRADEAATWRTAKSKHPPGSANGKPWGQGKTGPGAGKGTSGASRGQAKGTAQKVELLPEKPEPRVRKEVRIRQGGANDIGSLASRVKNLVLDSAASRAPREKKDTPRPAEGVSTPTA